MKKLILILILAISYSANSTIHVVQVWDGYYQFLPSSLTMNLGDTIEWRKLDDPMMYHTITSTNIPLGAVAFDEPWQMPADTFFQYVPAVAGTYYYECTPHATSYNMVGEFTVNPVAGISAVNANSIRLLPNPSTSTLEVQGGVKGSYSIVDLKGETLISGKLEGPISIVQLPPGDYLLLLKEEELAVRFTKL